MVRFPWRRALFVAATLLTITYCLALLAHVQVSPDIGIHCTFSPVVGRVFPRYLRSPNSEPIPDIVGCTVTQVGPYHIESCPEFLRALRQLQADPPGPSDSTRVKHGDEEWVRVLVQRRGEAEPFAVWCHLGSAPIESTVPAAIWLILEIGVFGVGALVYWKRPNDRAGGTFFALTTAAVGAFTGGYHWWQVITQPVLMVVFVISAVLLPAVTLHFYHVYPRPKPWLERRPRLGLLALYGVPAVMAVAVIGMYFRVRYLTRSDASGPDIHAAMRVMRVVVFAAFGVAAGWFVAGVACLVDSLRRAADAAERNQVKWILGGSLLALLPIGYTLALATFRPLDFVGGGASWPMFLASACVTVAYTISITRHRLLRLDLLLNSGMVYFVVSFLAGLSYYVLVFTFVLIVGRSVMPGPSLGQALWVSGSALVLLVVLDLLRGRITRTLERHFRRDKHQLDRTLHQLSEAIEHLVEPPTLARHLLDTSGDLLDVTGGAVYLGEGDPPLFRLAGVRGPTPGLAELAPGCPLVDALYRQPLLTLHGGRDDDACAQLRLLGGEVALALEQDGRLLGFLTLGPKTAGFYAPEDYNLLTALAPITALALQSGAARRTIAALNRDLQAKVEKISEQQGRILALQRQLVRQEGTAAGDRPAAPPAAAGPEIVGSSVVVGQLLDVVRKVAASPSAVLLRGESGTGKELLARAIHDNSPRAGQAFVKVHCAALSPTLLESELFGHVKGAFTGATGDKAGRFELAHGGTLFLDEIGDISLDVQTKLLRVLQEKVIERVGSGESVRVDVRVVAATHQNLERLIQQERFREDLFYRLNVIPITVPPLRDRREDIPELVQHFLTLFAAQLGRPVPDIDDDALAAIRSHAWPGNIRELRNVIERAVVLADGGTITPRELPAEWTALAGVPAPLSPKPAVSRRQRRAQKEDRLRHEREQLVRALAEARGNKAEAARALGMARSTFLSRMQKHGLQ